MRMNADDGSGRGNGESRLRCASHLNSLQSPAYGLQPASEPQMNLINADFDSVIPAKLVLNQIGEQESTSGCFARSRLCRNQVSVPSIS